MQLKELNNSEAQVRIEIEFKAQARRTYLYSMVTTILRQSYILRKLPV